jgi:hypothetical protein
MGELPGRRGWGGAIGRIAAAAAVVPVVLVLAPAPVAAQDRCDALQDELEHGDDDVDLDVDDDGFGDLGDDGFGDGDLDLDE